MKKGLSQIISSVLILAIAVSIAGIYAQWAPDFSRAITRKVVKQSNQDIKCGSAGINMREVRYDESGHLLELKLENTGTISLYNDISVAAIKDSRIAEKKTVPELEVGETLSIDINTTATPDTVLASSQSCPSLQIRTSRINVSG